MTRPAVGFLFGLTLLLLCPVTALADEPAYRTIIEGLVPKTPGVQIDGAVGGCDFLLTNSSGQDVVFLDQAGKAYRYTAPKKGAPVTPLPVHLAGAWPCASLPAITEDQRWNHSRATVLYWSVGGSVGSLAFKLQAHTDYDPSLDPSSTWMYYLRIGAGVAAVGGLLVAAPYLYARRRRILAPAR